MSKIVELKTNVKAKAKALVKESPMYWAKDALNTIEIAIESNDLQYIAYKRLALTYKEAIADQDYSFAGQIVGIVIKCLAEAHASGLQEHKDSVRYF